MKKKGKIITLIALLMIFVVPVNNVFAYGTADYNYTCSGSDDVAKKGSDGKMYCCKSYGFLYGRTCSGHLGSEAFMYKASEAEKELKPEACFICGNTQFSKYQWGVYYSVSACGKTNYSKAACAFTPGCYKITYPYGGGITYKYLSSPPSDFGLSGNNTRYTSVHWTNCNNSSGNNNDGLPSTPNNCSATYLYKSCTNSSCSGGACVSDLQHKLNAVQGCNLDEDGSFGSKTETCVIQFKSANNLGNDGIVDSKILSVLNSKFEGVNDAITPEAGTAAEFFTVTYNLDGGKFINGETSRNQILSNVQILTVPILPGKIGYKFLGWYIGDEKYEFGKTINSNITLTAKWEKTDLINPCNDGDIYDYEASICYIAQKFDDTSKTKYNGTTIYTKWTYNQIGFLDANGGGKICSLSGLTPESEGSNNTLECADGYEADVHWKSEDTCKEGGACNGNEKSCTKTILRICYDTYKAYAKTEGANDDLSSDENSPSNSKSDPKSDPKNDSKNDSKSDSKSSSYSVTNNPKTGSALIFTAWVVGFGALGYSIYYFRKQKKVELGAAEEVETDDNSIVNKIKGFFKK